MHYKIINLDNLINENEKEQNENQPYIPGDLHKILIISGSGSGKTNALFYLIKERNDNDKIYLYAEDLSKPKY